MKNVTEIIQEENEENELPGILEQVESPEAGRYALERLAAQALHHAQDAARNLKMLQDTQAQLREVSVFLFHQVA